MRLAAALLCLLLVGCSATTHVELEDGNKIKVKSTRYALVEVKRQGTEVTIDNRGRPGFIEQVFGAWLISDKREDVVK